MMRGFHYLPANVYSALLAWETGLSGRCGHPLFVSPQASFVEACRRPEALIVSKLPVMQQKARLLWVGTEPLTARQSLLQAGYRTHEILLARPANIFAAAVDEEEAPLRLMRLADMPLKRRFSRFVFYESTRHIDSLALFKMAASQLEAGGEMVILDAFTLHRSAPDIDRLHHLKYFLAQAQRFGLQDVEILDLTAEALPAVEAMLESLLRWRQRLIEEFALSRAHINRLQEQLERCRCDYAEHRRGYFLIRFNRSEAKSSERWQVSQVGEHESEAMRTLFAESFGHEMSEAEWRWKYCDDNAVALGVWEKSRLIAHIGGVKRPIVFFGEPHFALQICDLMVARASRSTLSRQGPAFLVVATIAECYIGYGSRFILCYGSPNSRARKLPEKLGVLGNSICDLVEIAWPPGGPVSSYSRVREVSFDDPAVRHAVDLLWPEMAADFAQEIIGVRDFAYLDYRFYRRPGVYYRYFLVSRRLDGAPIAFLIMAERADQGLELVDLVAPRKNFALAIRQARRIAHSLSAPRLFCWTGAHLFVVFSGGTMRELNTSVGFVPWTEGPAEERIRDKWMLLGGDFDFR